MKSFSKQQWTKRTVCLRHFFMKHALEVSVEDWSSKYYKKVCEELKTALSHVHSGVKGHQAPLSAFPKQALTELADKTISPSQIISGAHRRRRKHFLELNRARGDRFILHMAFKRPHRKGTDFSLDETLQKGS